MPARILPSPTGPSETRQNCSRPRWGRQIYALWLRSRTGSCRVQRPSLFNTSFTVVVAVVVVRKIRERRGSTNGSGLRLRITIATFIFVLILVTIFVALRSSSSRSFAPGCTESQMLPLIAPLRPHTFSFTLNRPHLPGYTSSPHTYPVTLTRSAYAPPLSPHPTVLLNGRLISRIKPTSGWAA